MANFTYSFLLMVQIIVLMQCTFKNIFYIVLIAIASYVDSDIDTTYIF